MSKISLFCGDALEVMPTLDACSVDAIVTDPPYGLSFMGKNWDRGIPGEAFWRETLRVSKPGAHLLAFGGTRTFHRLTCAIEDAGWEIRDCLMWVYGSGFPKSLDVSKAIDKAAGVRREVVGKDRSGPAVVAFARSAACEFDITAPATDAARQWQGWGTALKPAWEPIILAHKPLEGTVAQNVQKWGCGALNIDGCRVETGDTLSFGSRELGDGIKFGRCKPTTEGVQNPSGRWPANLIHEGSEEVVGMFPDGAARFFYCAKASKGDRDEGLGAMELTPVNERNQYANPPDKRMDHEQARNPAHNHHPTVKPTALMQYLCRLVTPPGGTVLDPFMGSGSTGRGAALEGFDFVGIDLDADYIEIARRRITEVAPLFVETTP